VTVLGTNVVNNLNLETINADIVKTTGDHRRTITGTKLFNGDIQAKDLEIMGR